MNARTSLAVLLTLGSSLVTAAPLEGGTTKRFLSPSEVMEIVEESETRYDIVCTMKGLPNVDPTDTANNLFPLSVQPLQNPCRTTQEDGSFAVAEYGFNSEISAMFDEAESLFMSRQYPKAIRSYQKIINRFPDCALAYAHLGDSYFKMEQYQKAIDYFDKAIQLNPFDHSTFVYKADSLLYLGKLAEAKAAYIHALSLRPRYWLAMANLQHLADKLGVQVRTDLFRPKALVRQEKDGIGVYLSGGASMKVWLPYALVKAIWLGEPSHREAYAGDSTYVWSSTEETEALLNLVMVYRTAKQAGDIEPDPDLDVLEEIIEAGDLPYFIVYEIASRMNPNVTLTVSEEVRQSLREFIAKYVVVSTAPPGARSRVAANVEGPASPKP